MRKAGVIGLGQIGSGAALCLARAGHLASVYDIRSEMMESFRQSADVADSPAAVASRSDVIIVAVVDAAQTLDVLSGPTGVLSAARPDAVVVLLATVSLDDLNEIRLLVESAGVGFIDAGVAGGAKAAEQGMILLVGGDTEQIERERPILESICMYIAHMGGPGAGMTAKIVKNAVTIGCFRAGHEGAALARAAGIDLEKLIQVFDDCEDPQFGPFMIPRLTADPRKDAAEKTARLASRKLIGKDLSAALQLGETTGTALPLAQLTFDSLDEILEIPDQGGGKAWKPRT